MFVDDQHCVRPGAIAPKPASPSSVCRRNRRLPPNLVAADVSPLQLPVEEAEPTHVGCHGFRPATPLLPSHNPPAEPVRCVTFLHYDYVRGKFTVRERNPATPAPDELLQTLRAANPNLARHSATGTRN